MVYTRQDYGNAVVHVLQQNWRVRAYSECSAAEMLGISGVGQTKLDRYGERFLAVLRDAAAA